MAKLFITDSASGERIPFLRGVLVESLARAGLSFQDAYVLAQNVRDSLGDESEIAIEALKQRVSEELKQNFGASLAESYDLGSSQEREILVRTENEEVGAVVEELRTAVEEGGVVLVPLHHELVAPAQLKAPVEVRRLAADQERRDRQRNQRPGNHPG